MSRRMSRITICLLVMAVAIAFMPLLSQDFASAKAVKAKKITLKASSKNAFVGGSVKVTVKSVKPKKAAKKVTWKITKGADNAVLTAKQLPVCRLTLPRKVL